MTQRKPDASGCAGLYTLPDGRRMPAAEGWTDEDVEARIAAACDTRPPAPHQDFEVTPWPPGQPPVGVMIRHIPTGIIVTCDTERNQQANRVKALSRVEGAIAHMMGFHGCWGETPKRHPTEPSILDRACGFDGRLTDARCYGCHRARAESPQDQLDALHALGAAARAQVE